MSNDHGPHDHGPHDPGPNDNGPKDNGIAKLGLSTYRWNNNLKSILLLAAFPLLLAALMGFIFFVFGLFTISPDNPYNNPFATFGIMSVLGTMTPADLAVSAIYAWWPIVFGIAAVWTLVGYFFNDAIIHAATGAKPVTRQEAPELYNLLENLCISRGMKTPPLYIIETDAMNAYASGIDEKSYSITVTSSLLNRLNKDELEAVLAHELTHIIDRDCRLLIVTIVFTGMISFLAQMLWRSLQVASYSRSRSRNGGGMVLVLMLIAGVALAIGYVLALVLRFAISRRRELLADAGSVDLTKNPSALISALLKISDNPSVPHVPTEVKQMFFENPPSSFDLGNLFSTHPTIAQRVRILQGLGGVVPDEAALAERPPEPLPEPPQPQSSQSPPGFRSPWDDAASPGEPPAPKSPWE